MKKVLMLSALFFFGWCCCCGELFAQTACQPSPACKVVCSGAKAGVAKTDAATAASVQAMPAGLFAPGTQPAAGAAKASCVPANCDPANCDPSKCDLSKCDPSKCDPAKCPPAACAGKGAKTERL